MMRHYSMPFLVLLSLMYFAHTNTMEPAEPTYEFTYEFNGERLGDNLLTLSPGVAAPLAKLRELIQSNDDAINILGYDPEIEILGESNNQVINPDRCTIALHGWGDSKEFIRRLKRHNPYSPLLPGTVITYNALDAVQDGHLPIAQSSFGQLPDIIPFLYVLKQCADADLPTIDINAHSRGAALAINGLAVLNNNTNKYNQVWDQLHINPAQREKIKAMIQKGCIVLQCPLVSVRAAIKNQVKTIRQGIIARSSLLNTLSNFMPSFSLKFSSSLGSVSDASTAASVEYAASTFTYYKAWEETPLRSIENLKGLDLKMLVHFEENDQVVTNEYDDRFYALLSLRNPSVHLSLGHNGSHNRMSESFFTELHTFRKLHGAAHLPAVK